jgi:hypothetical protein
VIRRTIDNPGGSRVHYGIVHYGTHLNDQVDMAELPVRLNPSYSNTVFRVRIDGLKHGDKLLLQGRFNGS